jgi:hypothetical protein
MDASTISKVNDMTTFCKRDAQGWERRRPACIAPKVKFYNEISAMRAPAVHGAGGPPALPAFAIHFLLA